MLFALHGANEAAVMILIPGLAWALPELFPRQRRLSWLRAGWVSNLCLLITTIAAAGLLLNGWSWWWALTAICLTLTTWDVHAFRRRVFVPESSLVGTTLRYYRAGSIDRKPQAGQKEEGQGDAKESEDAAREAPAEYAKADASESATLESRSAERTHLRALALVILAGLALTATVYELTARIRFSPALGVGLLLSIGLVVVLSLLARFLVRS